jgi:tetratricopeptide (TPR) repeat protein
MAHDVFISYSSNDKSFAEAMCAQLENRRIRCWIAPRDVQPGRDYAACLVEAIESTRVVVLILSAGSNSSPHVLREVERAVSGGKPVIPFRIEDVPLSKSMQYYVSSPHWLDALTPPLEAHLERLATTVASLMAASPTAGRRDGSTATRAPAPPVTTDNAALALQNAGRYAEASELWGALLEAGHDDGANWHNRGFCLEHNREGVRRGPGADLRGAMRCYTMAIERGLNASEDALLNIAVIANILGDAPQAEEYARKALRAAPWWFQPHGFLGAVLIDAGRYGEAVPALEKALELEPCDPAAKYNLAMVFGRLSRHEESLRYYEKFVNEFEACAAVVPDVAAYMRPNLPVAKAEIRKLAGRLRYSP